MNQVIEMVFIILFFSMFIYMFYTLLINFESNLLPLEKKQNQIYCTKIDENTIEIIPESYAHGCYVLKYDSSKLYIVTNYSFDLEDNTKYLVSGGDIYYIICKEGACEMKAD